MVKLDTIDIREVTRRTGLGKKAIMGRMDPTCSRFDPEFPLPIRQGRFIGWISGEVDAYVPAVLLHLRPFWAFFLPATGLQTHHPARVAPQPVSGAALP